MPRAKRGPKARRRRNQILKAASGFIGKRSRCHSIAAEAVHHSWQHAYKGRKQKKRDFRRLWIARINAATRNLGQSYSQVMGGLGRNDIQLNRKMLSEIAISDPAAFRTIVSAASETAK
ncbi:MAG: 50S ribosomal protein L20 [Myxococcales bacterium]|nr:50S ribosomal protein L20 [Myxococcales bacterium]